ncbi:MAG: hypothetical protein AB6733_13790 [Clostridiaceae bacterium]
MLNQLVKVNSNEELCKEDFIKEYFTKYPGLNFISEYSDDQILRLFKKSGYMALKEGNELEENFRYYLDFLRKTNDNIDISYNLVHEENDIILSSVGIMRVYNNTFLAHHFAAAPEARFNVAAKINLYLACYEFAYLDKEVKYQLSYYDSCLSWHKKIYTDFKLSINNEDLCDIIPVEFFEYTISSNKVKNKDFFCHHMDNYGEFVEYCEENLSLLERECYGFTDDGFNLNKLKEVYSKYGCNAERALFKVSYKESPYMYAVVECFPTGTNLHNIMDACHIYFAGSNYDSNTEVVEIAINSLLEKVNEFYIARGKTNYNILINHQGEHIKNIKVEGLEYCYNLSKFIIDENCFLKLKSCLFNKTKRLVERTSKR